MKATSQNEELDKLKSPNLKKKSIKNLIAVTKKQKSVDSDDYDEYYYDDSEEESKTTTRKIGKGRKAVELVQKTTENIEEFKDDDNSKYKRICVVTNWSQFRPGRGSFRYDHININLCNYLIFSAAAIVEENSMISDEFKLHHIQHNDQDLYAKLVSFKEKKSSLKIILRITDDNGRLFSKLSKKQESRRNFVKNTLDYANEFEFDGVDLDWQYPGGPSGSPHDKQNLISLLNEFKQQSDFNFLISLTISPFVDRIKNFYLLNDINGLVDILIVEAFDYAGPWDKRTGISAPLFKMEHQYASEAFANVDGTITYLKALGMNTQKIILGIAAYARSFVLQDPGKPQINSPTTGNGFSGSFTKINGLLSHYEICDLHRKRRAKWKIQWSEDAQAPFCYNSDGEWISYENEESLSKKIDYVKTMELGGVSINSIDMDDFAGMFCSKGPYPFLRASLGLLINNTKLEKSSLETTTISISTKIPNRGTPPKGRKVNKTTNRTPLTRKMTTAIQTTISPTTTKSIPTITLSVILVTPPTKHHTTQIVTLASEKSSTLNPEIEFHKALEEFRQVLSDKNLKPEKIIEKYKELLIKTNYKDDGILDLEKETPKVEPKITTTFATSTQSTRRTWWPQATTSHQTQKVIFVTPPQNENDRWLEQMRQHQIYEQNQLALQQQEWIQPQKVTQASPIVQHQEQIPQQWIPIQAPVLPVAPQIPQTQAESKCASKQSGTYREENDCSSFYVCEYRDNGLQYHKFQCPPGLTFNMNECTCDWPNESQRPCIVPLYNTYCVKREQQQQQQKFASEARTDYQFKQQAVPIAPIIQPFSCFGKQNGLHRDPYDCTKFYYCQITDLIVIKHDFNCPSGLTFNYRNCQCDWPQEHDSCNQILSTNSFNTYCRSTL